MYRLTNVVQHYKWGRRDFIPALLKIEAERGVEYAELWMGAHPNGSSKIESEGTERTLAELVGKNPKRWLGEAVRDRYGAYFPFMLKVLSINTALSIQAHPSSQQAIDGYQREERASIAMDNPARMYKDTHHKPELICALTPVWAMCGFRQRDAIERRFGEAPYQSLFEQMGRPFTIEKLFSLLLAVNDRQPEMRQRILRDVVEHINRLHPHLEHSVSAHAVPPDDVAPEHWDYWWVLRLMRQFPNDLGVLAPLYLNIFLLAPGEALYIGMRTPHSYLFGNGVEIMANSDNVLRCGLTQKHVDSQEILRIIDFDNSNYQRIQARNVFSGVVQYPAPVDEFSLVVVEGSKQRAIVLEHDALMPKIALCTEGELTISTVHTVKTPRVVPRGNSLVLQQGQSIFCLAQENTISIEGDGKLYIGIPSTEIHCHTLN